MANHQPTDQPVLAVETGNTNNTSAWDAAISQAAEDRANETDAKLALLEKQNIAALETGNATLELLKKLTESTERMLVGQKTMTDVCTEVLEKLKSTGQLNAGSSADPVQVDTEKRAAEPTTVKGSKRVKKEEKA